MRASVYTPYLETLGGGERYVTSFAKVLGDAGWHVDLESSNPNIIDKLEKRFGLKLTNIKVVKSINRGSGYDLCFWLSDGSIPSLLARNNIIHFQRPFFKVDGKSLISRMKFFRINKVVVNSKFTKKWIDKEYPVNSMVLYPPVDVSKFKPSKKENIIISIARFSQLEQSKRQDVLVDAFKKFYDKGNKNWKLVLAGGSEVGGVDFVKKLKELSVGYPIRIVENPEFTDIKSLYSKSKIFWSASGYNIDEEREPNRVEHFGITVVEAMAAGLIPMVFDAGGHKEIIKSNENGFLWKTVEDLLRLTEIISSDLHLQKKLSSVGKKDSHNFSLEVFKEKVLSII